MNAYDMFSELMMAKADAKGIPLSGTFELTSRCNLDCKMCYIHNRANDLAVKHRELSASQWIELAKACQKEGMLNLLLTGGEPLLRPDFKEIYLKCKELGFLVSVNSNAVLINDEMVEFFKENAPSRINITVYGASAETYEALCGDANAFARVMRAIRKLHEAGVLVKLNYSITEYNKHDMAKVIAFAKELGVHIQVASYMFPPVRACENGACETKRMTPQESAKLQVEWEKLRFGDAWLERAQKLAAGIPVPDLEKECQELPTERMRCRAGSSTFWVTWDGKMRLCGMMSSPSITLETRQETASNMAEDAVPGEQQSVACQSAGNADSALSSATCDDACDAEATACYAVGTAEFAACHDAGLVFKDAWQALRDVRQEIMVPAKCSNCESAHACDQCAAVCYAETGSFTEAPQYMCERTKAYLEICKESCHHE